MINLDKDNVRIHPDANKAAIKNSLSELGAGRSILMDKDDVLIAGNGVYEQAEALGIPIKVIETDGTELIAVKRTDLSTDDEKRIALAIADNRLTDLSEFDTEALNKMLDELSPEMQDLAGYAVDPNDLMNEGNTDEDEVPEVTEATCKLGDLWILGNHRLLCGDSTDKEQVEKLMDGEKADMVFTDPPYGMGLDTDYSKIKGSAKSIGFKGNKVGNKYEPIIGDNADFVPELITTITDNFSYCKEMFIFGADYFIDLLPNCGKDGCLLVWNKRSSDAQQRGIGNTFELFWSKHRHKKYVFSFEWFGFLSKDAPQEARNRVHPSMKPIGLIERIFLWFKSPAGITVDLYLGSGSTLIACEKTNRKCYGMELDPHYCDVIIKRWEDYTGDTAVLHAI